MDRESMMPVRAKQATMWTLSAYRKTVRLAVPSLRITGMPEPLAVYMDFDAVTVDAMLERLSILHGKMLPPLPAPNKSERPFGLLGVRRPPTLHKGPAHEIST